MTLSRRFLLSALLSTLSACIALAASGPLFERQNVLLLGFLQDTLLLQRREGSQATPQIDVLDAWTGASRGSLTLADFSNTLRSPSTSRNGEVLALPDGAMITLWNLKDGTRLPDVGTENEPPVHGLALSDDGRLLAVGRQPGYAQVWDLRTGRRLRSFVGHGERVAAVSLGRDTLLTGALDGTIRVWDLHSGQVLHATRTPEPQRERAVYGGILTPDGKTYVVRTSGGRVWLGRVGTSNLTQLDVSNARGFAVTGAGDFIFVNGHDRDGVAVVDVALGKVRASLPNSWVSGEHVAVSPAGNLVAQQKGSTTSSDVRVLPFDLPQPSRR